MITINGGTPYSFGGYQTLGYEFTPTNSVNVSALGLWDKDEDGLVAYHQVGLWRKSDSTLLAETNLPFGTGARLIGGCRYVNLDTAVTLTEGTAYVIGASYYFDGVGDDFVTIADIVPSGVTWDGGRINDGDEFAMPDEKVTSDFEPSMFGPNLLSEPFPQIELTGMTRSNNTLVLQWQANRSNLLYAVESCTNLSSEDWQRFAPTSQWWISETVWTNTGPLKSEEFFRVQAKEQ